MSEAGGEAAAVALDGAVAAVDTATPDFKLYPIKHIWWTAVIGGPLPSAWMMAANYKRLGDVKKSRIAAGVGALVIVAIMALGEALDRQFGGGGFRFGVVIAIGVRSLATSLQGPAIAAHQERGGRFESAWKSTGIMLVGIAETLFGAAVLVGLLQTTVVIGGTHKILVDGMASEADARRMGEVLTEAGLLVEGQETEMSLEKTRDAWTVTINVNDGFLEKPDLAELFEPVANQLRERAFPDVLRLKLVLARGLHRKTCERFASGQLECK
jgi:hypothetical protein